LGGVIESDYLSISRVNGILSADNDQTVYCIVCIEKTQV